MSAELAQKFLNELIEDLKAKRLVLPTLPEVALKVRDAVEDDNASLSEIARIIATDAAISARLIQVANSPLMRASKAIDSLETAVNRLGMKLVKDLVTSMAMQQMFQATSEVTDKKLRQIWEHSTQVAAIAHTLARQFTKLSPEQAMLAGLIHAIGALPIITKAEDYPELLANEALLDKIIEHLQGRIGEAILREWNFPGELAKVPAEHRDLSRNSPQVDYVDVVTVANLQSLIGSNDPLAKQDWSQVPAFAKLGLSADVNVIEMELTAEDIKEAKRLLS